MIKQRPLQKGIGWLWAGYLLERVVPYAAVGGICGATTGYLLMRVLGWNATGWDAVGIAVGAFGAAILGALSGGLGGAASGLVGGKVVGKLLVGTAVGGAASGLCMGGLVLLGWEPTEDWVDLVFLVTAIVAGLHGGLVSGLTAGVPRLLAHPRHLDAAVTDGPTVAAAAGATPAAKAAILGRGGPGQHRTTR